MNESKKWRKGKGIPFSKWLGEIPQEYRQNTGWKTWRDFYNDDLTPEDAIMQVRL